jgi:hypothetical protein
MTVRVAPRYSIGGEPYGGLSRHNEANRAGQGVKKPSICCSSGKNSYYQMIWQKTITHLETARTLIWYLLILWSLSNEIDKTV